jgi:ankyrin repeat protein
MTAVQAENVTVDKQLIASGAAVNAKGGGREQSPLLWAIGDSKYDVMKVLLENGAKVDDQTEMRRNFVAFSRGNPQGGRLTGIADQTAESDGTRPGLRWVNRGGLTPLIVAAMRGDVEGATILLGAGANINAVDGLGSTALMVAIRNDMTTMAKFLIDKGADPNIDTAGHVALHIAVARKELPTVKALVEHGAKVNVRLVKGEPDPEGNRRFNQLPEFLAGATPFLMATALNDVPTMKYLLEKGADAKIAMQDGTTSTMAAMGIFPGVFTFIPFVKVPPRGAAGDNTAYFQRAKLFKEKTVLECLKITVEQGGVDVNAARGQLTTYHVGNSRTLVGRDVGDTALHMATADKYPTVVEYLVSKGARMDVKDKRGLTPLALAKSPKRQFITGGDNGEIIGDPGMVAVLQKLGAQE